MSQDDNTKYWYEFYRNDTKEFVFRAMSEHPNKNYKPTGYCAIKKKGERAPSHHLKHNRASHLKLGKHLKRDDMSLADPAKVDAELPSKKRLIARAQPVEVEAKKAASPARHNYCVECGKGTDCGVSTAKLKK